MSDTKKYSRIRDAIYYIRMASMLLALAVVLYSPEDSPLWKRAVCIAMIINGGLGFVDIKLRKAQR